MSRAPALFRQRDLTRAVKATEAAGVKVGSVSIAPDGRITIMIAGEQPLEPLTPLEKWKAERDARRAEGPAQS